MSQPSFKTSSVYRPDIDGLRAIAVLSVILFHIDKTLMPGGFVGVDIFFVISGFLISRNILQDLEGGRFSIVDFYRRRIKRIAPPMLLVIGITVVAGQLLLLPEDAKKTAVSALWSLLSLANVYFWLNQDTGYFAAASAETPLLHLWSLGVEEQFYLVWPLILIAAYRPQRAKIFFFAAVAFATISFFLAESLFKRDPAFVYYMLPTRAGELLVGAIVALAVLKEAGRKVPKGLVTPMAALGFALLGASLFAIREENVFPGLLAVPPTFGAALLIFARHCGDNFVSRGLAFKPLVLIGLISYSSYLWHWPLLAFYRYGHGSIDGLAGSVLFVSTLLLAWLTYRFVERPARLAAASSILIFLRQYIVPAGALACVSLAAWKFDGFGLRWLSDDYKSKLVATRQETLPAYSYPYVCQRQKITQEDAVDDRCLIGLNVAAAPRVILWGDSNAAHYIGMLGTFAKNAGFQFRNLEVGSCPPIFIDPQKFVTAKRLTDCRDSIAVIRPVIETFDTIIVSANWTSYQERSDTFLSTFFDTVRTLTQNGKVVILLGKAPLIPHYDRRCREKALSYPLLNCPSSSIPLAGDIADINAKLQEFARGTANVRYFEVTPYLCPQGLCSAFDSRGRPLYYDPSHLSMTASWQLGNAIWEQSGLPPAFNLLANRSQ